ncbi:MAG: hypothetical protein U0837_06785 [Dehalococcoidia bacterium]|jgi:hypothetical protein
MDLFELFDNDGPENERRRNNANGEEQPRRKGVRGFFQRWMATFRDDDDYDHRDGDRKKRRDADYSWD